MSEQQASEPQLCVNCSKFFGTATHGGLCSGCFKDASKSGNVQAKPTAPIAIPSAAVSAVAASEAAVSATPPSEAEDGTKVQKNKGKCFVCKAKVSLVQQATNLCRCGFVFCDAHRIAEAHSCDFDHKTSGRSAIAKQLPKQAQSKGRGIHRLESVE